MASPADTDWMDAAACKGAPPNTMFPHEADFEGIAEAKSFCAVCPVRYDCGDYALARRENDGVWGGMSEAERRRVIRHRRSHPISADQLTFL